MARWLAIACLVLACAVSARAQTAQVSGTVVDESGAGVPGATVQLAGASSRDFTTSGPGGAYQFSNIAVGTYEVTATLVGFAPAAGSRILVGPNVSPVVAPALTLKLATLSETVVVSATKTNTSLIDAPATMSVITNAELKASPAQNYADLLRRLPGVNVIQMSARDVNITSRQATGSLANTELVVLDGRSVYLDFFGIVLWDLMPQNMSDIKQIEVIRGPAAAIWGANALTGVINIITKTPREATGSEVTFTGGFMSRDAGSKAGQGAGGLGGANASFADAPNDTWSYKVTAGYFKSAAFPRPTGQIPLITDPRDPTLKVGGAMYPSDGTGAFGTAFTNRGANEPKFDARVDQELGKRGRLTYEGGVAGTQGVIYTGVGPFDIQSGSYLGFGRVNYERDALKVNFFVNVLHADAPNLLFPDASTGKALQMDLTTKTYDFEVGNATPVGTRNVVSYGGNVRRNNFAITLAPTAQDRSELGAYAQDEIFIKYVRLNIGGRIDKFGNLDGATFSPRLSANFKVAPEQSLRVSFNRAFKSPSVVNNYPQRVDHFAAGSQRTRAVAARAASASGGRAVSAGGACDRQRAADRRDRAAEAERRVADGVRSRVHRHGDGEDDAQRGVLRERPDAQHQLRAAADEARSVHRGESSPRLAAAAVHSHRDGAARHLPAENGVHVSESRSAASEGRRALTRPSRGPAPVDLRELLVAGHTADSHAGESRGSVPDGGARVSADESRQCGFQR